MKIVRSIAELELTGVVGLVPTMGALHDGHRSLFKAGRAENDVLVASLFVNPAQFDRPDDLAGYPSDEQRDLEIAEEEGVDVLFAPTADEMYPAGYGTWVDVEGTGAEGTSRPGHFRAVATVCVKLFNIVQPRRAYFGQKDAQQAAVVRRVVRDLNLDIEIRVLPTIRDQDGLAISSRNVQLSPDERTQALVLPRALALGAETNTHGGDVLAVTRSAFNGLTPEYIEILEFDGVTVLTSALRVGSTRLIDNVLLKGDLS